MILMVDIDLVADHSVSKIDSSRPKL
jgi:hypothetical protein